MGDFPAGVVTRKLRLRVTDIEGGSNQTYWTLDVETPFIWAANGQMFFGDQIRKTLRKNEAIIEVPVNDQSGFVDGNGAAITGWAMRSSIYPTRTSRLSKVAPYVKTFYVTSASPAIVDVGTFTDIGAWPHSETVYVPVPGGSGVLVEDPANPGYFKYV